MKTFITCILMLMVIQSYTQQPAKRPCPRFIISRTEGEVLRNNLTSLFPDIRDHLEVDSIYVDKKSFLQMLKRLTLDEDVRMNFLVNGMRVILGQEGDSLQLIFTGVKDFKDTGEYFVANKNGILKPRFDTDNLAALQAKYANTTLQYVNTISPDNTTSFVFNNGLLYDLITEMTRLRTADIKGLYFKLGAYRTNHPLYPKKIMVGFTFVKTDGTEVLLQDLSVEALGCDPDTAQPVRTALIKEFKNQFAVNNVSSKIDDKKIEDFVEKVLEMTQAINGDTGVPCPPGRNCGTATIQP